MSEKLKPFSCGCGGETKVIKHEYFECSPTYGVTCQKCGTATNQGFDTEAEAVEAWNRAMSGSVEEKLKAFWDGMSAEMKEERTAKVDAGHKSVITGKLMDGHCMQCGRYVMDEDDYCPGCGCRLEWNE